MAKKLYDPNDDNEAQLAGKWAAYAAFTFYGLMWLAAVIAFVFTEFFNQRPVQIGATCTGKISGAGGCLLGGICVQLGALLFIYISWSKMKRDQRNFRRPSFKKEAQSVGGSVVGVLILTTIAYVVSIIVYETTMPSILDTPIPTGSACALEQKWFTFGLIAFSIFMSIPTAFFMRHLHSFVGVGLYAIKSVTPGSVEEGDEVCQRNARAKAEAAGGDDDDDAKVGLMIGHAGSHINNPSIHLYGIGHGGI